MKLSENVERSELAAEYISTLALMPILERRMRAICKLQMEDESYVVTGTDRNILRDYKKNLKVAARLNSMLYDLGMCVDSLERVANRYIDAHEGRAVLQSDARRYALDQRQKGAQRGDIFMSTPFEDPIASSLAKAPQQTSDKAATPAGNQSSGAPMPAPAPAPAPTQTPAAAPATAAKPPSAATQAAPKPAAAASPAPAKPIATTPDAAPIVPAGLSVAPDVALTPIPDGQRKVINKIRPPLTPTFLKELERSGVKPKDAVNFDPRSTSWLLRRESQGPGE